MSYYPPQGGYMDQGYQQQQQQHYRGNGRGGFQPEGNQHHRGGWRGRGRGRGGGGGGNQFREGEDRALRFQGNRGHHPRGGHVNRHQADQRDHQPRYDRPKKRGGGFQPGPSAEKRRRFSGGSGHSRSPSRQKDSGRNRRDPRLDARTRDEEESDLELSPPASVQSGRLSIDLESVNSIELIEQPAQPQDEPEPVPAPEEQLPEEPSEEEHEQSEPGPLTQQQQQQQQQPSKEISGGYTCLLCPKNEKYFKDKSDFAIHLTFIHYKEKIMKQIGGPPYRCINCNYAPLDNKDKDQMCDDLVMHYGMDEDVSYNFYKKDIGDVADQAATSSSSSNQQNPVITCKICGSTHENERLFVRHLSLRHYTQKLCDELPKRSPYTCPFIDCPEKKTNLHKLMLHYGCQHNISMDLYKERHGALSAQVVVPRVEENEAPVPEATMAPLPVPEVTMPPLPVPVPAVEAVCTICKASFVTLKSMNYHLFLFHYNPVSSSGPYNCPKCHETFETGEKGRFVAHCVAVHMEQFKGDFELASAQGNNPTTVESHPTEKTSSKDPRRPPKQISSFPVPVRAVSSPTGIEKPKKAPKPSSANQASPFEAAISAGDPATPAARFKKTTHRLSSSPANQAREGLSRQVSGELTARQRVRENWGTNSYEPQKAKIQELEDQIKDLQEAHRDAMKKKGEDFEKWINQKENSLAQESDARKAVEEQLQKVKVDNVDLQKQLERNTTAKESLEETLAEKHALNHKTSKEKKALEKKVNKLESTAEQLEKEAEEKDEEIKTLKDKTETELKDLKISLEEKEESIKELNTNHEDSTATMEKKLARLEKQIEHHKTRADKLAEDKKEKVAAMKEQAKKFKEVENDLVSKIQSVEEERKASNSQQLAMKKELKKIEKSAESTAKLEEVSKERDSALDSLEKLQLVLNQYEESIVDTKKQLEESAGRCEELETNLDEALTKLSSQKGNEKERKEMNSMVKRLQSTLKEYEERQFSQIHLISGLQKEKDAQAKKIKDFEENHTGAEEELYEMSQTIKKKEKELKAVQTQLELSEQAKDKAEARLESLNLETASKQQKIDQREEQVRDLEREIRRSDTEDVMYLRNNLLNAENELKHFRTHHNKMKADLGQSAAELRKELNVAKQRNEKFEDDYSKLAANHETLKATLKDNHRHSLKKQKDHEALLADYKALMAEQKASGKFPPASASPSKKSRANIKMEQSISISPTDSPLKVKEEPIDHHTIELPTLEDIPDSSHTLMNNPVPMRPALPPMIRFADKKELFQQKRVDTTSKQLIINAPINAFQLAPAQQKPSTSTADRSHIPTKTISLEGGPSYTVFNPPAATRVKPVVYNSIHEDNALPTQHLDPLDDLPDLETAPLSYQHFAPPTNMPNRGRPKGRGGRGGLVGRGGKVSPAKKTVHKKVSAPAVAAKAIPSANDDASYRDDDTVVCGICHQYDPPLPDVNADPTKAYKTRWIGCECSRWYHCQCTKLARITPKFKCKSIKFRPEKCLKKVVKKKAEPPQIFHSGNIHPSGL